MKTLGQIIDEVQDGGKPDYEDLRYAVVALSALATFDRSALMKLATAKKEGKPQVLTRDPIHQCHESFRRAKTALETPPKQWVGLSHDPDTEECQEWRKLSKKVLKRVIETKVGNSP